MIKTKITFINFVFTLVILLSFSKNVYSQCVIPNEYQGNTGGNMTFLMLSSFIDSLTYQSDNPYLVVCHF